MNTPNLSRRNMYLPDSLVDQLKDVAYSRGISYSELVRMVLTRYVAKLQPK
jgi:predicted DNA binding CopG/RHH family protein